MFDALAARVARARNETSILACTTSRAYLAKLVGLSAVVIANLTHDISNLETILAPLLAPTSTHIELAHGVIVGGAAGELAGQGGNHV